MESESFCCRVSCCVKTGGGQKMIFGEGTRLTVETSKNFTEKTLNLKRCCVIAFLTSLSWKETWWRFLLFRLFLHFGFRRFSVNVQTEHWVSFSCEKLVSWWIIIIIILSVSFCTESCCCVKTSGVEKILFGAGTKVTVESSKSAHRFIILSFYHPKTRNLSAQFCFWMFDRRRRNRFSVFGSMIQTYWIHGAAVFEWKVFSTEAEGLSRIYFEVFVKSFDSVWEAAASIKSCLQLEPNWLSSPVSFKFQFKFTKKEQLFQTC